MAASALMAAVDVSSVSTTDLGSYLQSNTSFINPVYNEYTHNFVNSFDVAGYTWSKVSNFTSFDVSVPGISVTLIDINYTESIPFDIGFKNGKRTTEVWSNLNNRSVFDTNTFNLSTTSNKSSVSFYSVYHDSTKTYQSDQSGWAFYNIAGTSTFLAFIEAGSYSGVDYNDGVLLMQAVPEPATYALWLGLGTIAIVLYRARRQKSIKHS